MTKSLKDYKKSEYRFQKGEVFLREPNKIERQELMNVIFENQKLIMNKSVVEEEVGATLLRYVLKMFTNFSEEIDNLSDEEIGEVLENPSREIELLVDNIQLLIEECVEDIGRNVEKQYRKISELLNVFDMNGDYEAMKAKWNKLNKKYKLKMDFDELISNKEKQQELINQLQEQK